MTWHDYAPFYAKVLRSGYGIGFSSVGWDLKNQRLKISDSRLRHLWIKFQFGLELCYQLFLAYKCLEAMMDPRRELRHKIRLQYLFVLYVLLNCNHMVTLFTGPEFVNLMNGFGAFVTENLNNGNRICLHVTISNCKKIHLFNFTDLQGWADRLNRDCLLCSRSSWTLSQVCRPFCRFFVTLDLPELWHQ